MTRPSFRETLDPSDPAIVNPENERRHRALTGIRKVISPIRDEVREEQREAKRAYDIANPPAAQDAKAADAIEAKIAAMLAGGIPEKSGRIAAMRADVATLRARRDPNRPKQTTCTPVAQRTPFPLDAHEDDEVEGLVVTGPLKEVRRTVREAQRGAQRTIADRGEPPRVRVSEFIDEHEDEIVAELERRKAAR